MVKPVTFPILVFITKGVRSLLFWVAKPVTFPVLAFTKRVKQAILLGGETCDISYSRIRNKMCQGTCYVGWWNLWHFSFSYSQQNVTIRLLCWVVKPVTFSVLVFATKCVKERVILGAETCDISHSRETTESESDTGIWVFVTASLTYSRQFHL